MGGQADVFAVDPFVHLVGAGADRDDARTTSLPLSMYSLGVDDPHGVAGKPLVEQHVRLLGDDPDRVFVDRFDMGQGQHEAAGGADQRVEAVAAARRRARRPRRRRSVPRRCGTSRPSRSFSSMVRSSILVQLSARPGTSLDEERAGHRPRGKSRRIRRVEHGIGDADRHIAHLLDGLKAAGQSVHGHDQVRTFVGECRRGEAKSQSRNRQRLFKNAHGRSPSRGE
jgi:hypothetical protein